MQIKLLFVRIDDVFMFLKIVQLILTTQIYLSYPEYISFLFDCAHKFRIPRLFLFFALSMYLSNLP